MSSIFTIFCIFGLFSIASAFSLSAIRPKYKYALFNQHFKENNCGRFFVDYDCVRKTVAKAADSQNENSQISNAQTLDFLQKNFDQLTRGNPMGDEAGDEEALAGRYQSVYDKIPEISKGKTSMSKRSQKWPYDAKSLSQTLGDPKLDAYKYFRDMQKWSKRAMWDDGSDYSEEFPELHKRASSLGLPNQITESLDRAGAKEPVIWLKLPISAIKETIKKNPVLVQGVKRFYKKKVGEALSKLRQ